MWPSNYYPPYLILTTEGAVLAIKHAAEYHNVPWIIVLERLKNNAPVYLETGAAIALHKPEKCIGIKSYTNDGIDIYPYICIHRPIYSVHVGIEYIGHFSRLFQAAALAAKIMNADGPAQVSITKDKELVSTWQRISPDVWINTYRKV